MSITTELIGQEEEAPNNETGDGEPDEMELNGISNSCYVCQSFQALHVSFVHPRLQVAVFSDTAHQQQSWEGLQMSSASDTYFRCDF